MLIVGVSAEGFSILAPLLISAVPGVKCFQALKLYYPCLGSRGFTWAAFTEKKGETVVVVLVFFHVFFSGNKIEPYFAFGFPN